MTPFPDLSNQQDRIRITAATGKISAIINIVANQYRVRAADLLGSRRSKWLTVPRHVAMWLAYELTDKSQTQIGHVFRRDHTTIMHGIRNVDAWIQSGSEDGYIALAIKRALTKEKTGDGA